jgi:hypothetical protein
MLLERSTKMNTDGTRGANVISSLLQSSPVVPASASVIAGAGGMAAPKLGSCAAVTAGVCAAEPAPWLGAPALAADCLLLQATRTLAQHAACSEPRSLEVYE